MRKALLLMTIALGAAGCASGGYASAEVVYAGPADREVLLSRAWVRRVPPPHDVFAEIDVRLRLR